MTHLPTELERLLDEDALECARRTLRHKFGRLSRRRIVRLLRGAAESMGQPLEHSDADLVELWFSRYDQFVSEVRSERRHSA